LTRPHRQSAEGRKASQGPLEPQFDKIHKAGDVKRVE
jgi:hypothetical protein